MCMTAMSFIALSFISLVFAFHKFSPLSPGFAGKTQPGSVSTLYNAGINFANISKLDNQKSSLPQEHMDQLVVDLAVRLVAHWKIQPGFLINNTLVMRESAESI